MTDIYQKTVADLCWEKISASMLAALEGNRTFAGNELKQIFKDEQAVFESAAKYRFYRKHGLDPPE